MNLENMMTIIIPTEEELNREIATFQSTRKEAYDGIRGISIFNETIIPKSLQKPKKNIYDPKKQKKIVMSYTLSDDQKKSFNEFIDPLKTSTLNCFSTYADKIVGVNILSVNEGFYKKSRHCLSPDLYRNVVSGIESVLAEIEPIRFSFEKFMSTPHSIIAFANTDENGLRAYVRNKVILEKAVLDALYPKKCLVSKYAKRHKVEISKDLKIVAAKFKKKLTMDELSKEGFPLYLEYVAKELPVGKSSSIFISEITTLRSGFESKYTRRYFI